MLVALLNGDRIQASRSLNRGEDYRCPGYGHPLILKAGEKRIAHFSHLPGTHCAWAAGETLEHLGAKKALCDAFTARGLKAVCEQVVDCLPGDRRADVMVWSPRHNIPVAIELQHTNISEWEIRARAAAYARAGIAQIWIPILRAKHCPPSFDDHTIERYSPRPFERWLHENMPSPVWYYDPVGNSLWRGRVSPCWLWKEETQWFDDSGDERSEGGYHYESKRCVTLHLTDCFAPEELLLKLVPYHGMACATFIYDDSQAYCGEEVAIEVGPAEIHAAAP